MKIQFACFALLIASAAVTSVRPATHDATDKERSGNEAAAEFILPALHTNQCANIKMIPERSETHWMDGQWAICRDAFHIKDKCVVYAAGARDDISFDKALAEEGCEVHTFDPTLQELHGFVAASGIAAEAQNAGVAFHDYGWGGEDKTYPPGSVPYTWPGVGWGMQTNESPWTLKTLSSVMSELNTTRLDVLKMDIEGAEWAFLAQALANPTSRHFLQQGRIKQIVMEVHFMPPRGTPETQSPFHPVHVRSTNDHFSDILADLESTGFVSVWQQPNGQYCQNIGLIWTGHAQNL